MVTTFTQQRILVVDDNREAADLMVEILNVIGHITRVAYNGAQTLEVAAEFQPDVILLDLGMPVMDGYQVASVLRQSDTLRATALVAFTGWTDIETRKRVREAGFDYHLPKPASLDSVLRALQFVQKLPQNLLRQA